MNNSPQLKVELYHDILARKVFEKASPADKMRRQYEQLIRDRYRYYQDGGALLGKSDLELINPFLKDLQLRDEEMSFISTSHQELEKITVTKRRIVFGAIIILAVFLLFALIQLFKAKESESAQKRMWLALQASTALENGQPSLAFRLAQLANDSTKNEASVQQIVNNVFSELVASHLHCDLVHDAEILAFDVRDSFVLTASADGWIKIWDLDCNFLKEFQSIGPVRHAFFSPDSIEKILYSAGDSTVNVKDWVNGYQKKIQLGCEAKIVSFSPDGQYFLVGDSHHMIRLFDAQVEEIESSRMQFGKDLIAGEFSPRGHSILGSSRDSILVKDVTQIGFERRALKIKRDSSPFEHVHFFQSDSFKDLLIVTTAVGANVFDIQTGEKTENSFYKKLNDRIKVQANITGINFGKDSVGAPRALILTNDTLLQAWTYGRLGVVNGKDIAVISRMDFNLYSQSKFLYNSFSSTNEFLIISYTKNRFEIRDAYTGSLITDIKAKVQDAKFSFGDNSLITLANEPVVHIWNSNFGSRQQNVDSILIFKQLNAKLRILSKDEQYKYEFKWIKNNK